MTKEKKRNCPPGKIMNPKTGRCVNRNGKLGKEILKKSSKKAKSPKRVQSGNCPPGKIMNPKTGRCVNRNGKLGKEILKKSSRKTKSPKRVQSGNCPPGKIMNPKTGRCVNRDGKIGKEILKNKTILHSRIVYNKVSRKHLTKPLEKTCRDELLTILKSYMNDEEKNRKKKVNHGDIDNMTSYELRDIIKKHYKPVVN